MLEVGCGLGYSALWLAWGSAPDGRVETIEKDEEHARLARAHFEEAHVGHRIEVLLGPAQQVLPSLSGPYDFIFVDSDWTGYPALLPYFVRLLRPGGLLVSSNLWPATYAPGLNGLPEVAEYRRQLMEEPALFTTFLTCGPALSVKVAG
jgi:predicted O-methyltransferase YrrM